MSIPGLEGAIHVFFALLSLLSASALLALLFTNSKDKKTITYLAIATAIFVWLSWFTVIPVYTVEYGADKAVIKAHPETAAAHNFGMETKEHIFHTGLFLATLLPIFALSIDITSPNGRRLLMWAVIILILGGLVMEGLGGWIATAARIAWYLEAGGGLL